MAEKHDKEAQDALRFVERLLQGEEEIKEKGRKKRKGYERKRMEDFTQKDIYGYMMRSMTDITDETNVQDMIDMIRGIEHTHGSLCSRFHEHIDELMLGVDGLLTHYRNTRDETYRELAVQLLKTGQTLADHHQVYHLLSQVTIELIKGDEA